jgi:hypothetical protein
MSTPSASGLSVRQVNRILASVPTIHVSTFVADEIEPIHELWISRAGGTVISESRRERTVYDLTGGRMTVVGANRTSTESVDLDERERADLEETMRQYLEFSLKNVRLDAELQPVAGDNATSNGVSEVYELIWEAMASNGAVPQKWVLFVDPSTRLPQVSELCRGKTMLGPWELETRRRYDYPSQNELEKHRETLLSPQ